MATTYTVKKGDTLSKIAAANGTTWQKLAELNDLDNPNFITPGQVLKLSGEKDPAVTAKNKQAKIKLFGLQADTDSTMFATWAWDKDHTEHYAVKWYYDTGDGVWFVGNSSNETYKQTTYNAPSNADRVKFKVKPISKKDKKVNGKETYHWTADWSETKTYAFKNNPPTAPSSAPSVGIKKYKLTAELSGLEDLNATSIQFQIVKNNKSVFNTGTATIKTGYASYSCNVTAGGEYKVRCRAVRGKLYSDWTEYSDNYTTIPAASDGFKTIKALSETSVYLDWENVSKCTGYELQYTTKKSYFDSSNEVQSMTVESVVGHAEVTGLESGQQYFFRVRAINEQGESAWCDIKSIIIGKAPAAPTTWSSTTTVITGDPLTLYWVHNAEDNSSQTYAELELIIDGKKETHTITNSTDEDEKDKTSYYDKIDTSSYNEGVQIKWRVRTAGITKTYGDWSIERIVDVYAPPTLDLTMTDVDGNDIETLTTFPFSINGLAGPNTQIPIGYHVSIVSNEFYETVDSVGNEKIVNAGDAVYSRYFDTSEALEHEMSASDVDLENDKKYELICTVSMNSGLTAESSLQFSVSWTDDKYVPDADIIPDPDTFTTYVSAFCQDDDENLIDGVTLSIYRHEFDGSFTELITGLDNKKNTFITDPHPSLDLARYRIVAITNDTGAVTYYDKPGFPMNGKAVVITWDEEWSNFELPIDPETGDVVEIEEALEKPPWSGSILVLPYNIDVSDNYSADVELVEYIGRAHPVSYYGTQLGESATWNVSIEKSDTVTLYALRRLAKWMGDVYVREPSGSGYWANITVSFSQKHTELTIPVTLDIVRVEGGV